MNMTATSPFPSLSNLLHRLRQDVAAWGGMRLLQTMLVVLLHRRLGQILGRMERLVARFQAGRLWRIEARISVRSETAGGAAAQRLPRAFAWLVRLVAHRAVPFGLQLQAILEQPEMVALLEAAPQAGIILRPLCRMLAVPSSVLRLPPPRRVRDTAGAPEASVPAVTSGLRAPRDWGRSTGGGSAGEGRAGGGIPLPRGVLAAARRAKSANRS